MSSDRDSRDTGRSGWVIFRMIPTATPRPYRHRLLMKNGPDGIGLSVAFHRFDSCCAGDSAPEFPRQKRSESCTPTPSDLPVFLTDQSHSSEPDDGGELPASPVIPHITLPGHRRLHRASRCNCGRRCTRGKAGCSLWLPARRASYDWLPIAIRSVQRPSTPVWDAE